MVDIVPDSFRFARDFLPALKSEWRSLSFRLGKRFVEEAKRPRRWALDEKTPFEDCRVLDPVPDTKLANRALTNLQRAFPFFGKAEVEQYWGGMIDVTPDAVPVISPVATRPGFFIASGFSGHGFGIAPAAGQLAADLVMGSATPIVDPAPFSIGRLRPKLA